METSDERSSGVQLHLAALRPLHHTDVAAPSASEAEGETQWRWSSGRCYEIKMWSRQDHLHNRTHICMWFEFIRIIHFELIGFIYIIKNDNQQHSISASSGAYLRPSLNVTIQDFHSFEFATLNQCNCSLLLRFNRPLRLSVPSRAAKYFYSNF